MNKSRGPNTSVINNSGPVVAIIMYGFYHQFKNLHFRNCLHINGFHIPISSLFLGFECMFEMQVVEMIVRPPYE